MSRETRNQIREAVSLAMEYWPNSHLGDYSRQEDMQSAFRIIRRRAEHEGLHNAICHVMRDAYRHADM